MLAERVKQWTQEWKQEGLQEGRQEGLQEGRQEECISLVTRLLRRKFGLHPELDLALAQLPTVPVEKLEDLVEVIFDWTKISDLTEWLNGDNFSGNNT
jgi:predicted transposase YdaD